MKRLLNISLSLILALMLCACSDEMDFDYSPYLGNSGLAYGEVEIPQGPTIIEVDSSITRVRAVNEVTGKVIGDFNVSDGKLRLAAKNYTPVTIYDISNSKNEKVSSIMLEPMTEEAATISKTEQNATVDPKPMLSFLQSKSQAAKSSPLTQGQYSTDFLYISQGEPITIYPSYSNTASILTLGIFYYDEDNTRHDIDIWAINYQWTTNYRNGQTNIVSKSNAPGITIDLPKDYHFGFYIKSKATNAVASNNAETTGNYTLASENTCESSHAITMSENGKTYIAFEEDDEANADYTSLICVIEPSLETISNPTTDYLNGARLQLSQSKDQVVLDESDFIRVSKCDYDIEARLINDKKSLRSYSYLRIAIPLDPTDNYDINLSKITDQLSLRGFDFRISGNSDATIANTDSIGVSIVQENINKYIYKVNASPHTSYGIFQIKAELRPKAGYDPQAVTQLLASLTCDDMVHYTHTDFHTSQGLVYWDEATKNIKVDTEGTLNLEDYYKVLFKKSTVRTEFAGWYDEAGSLVSVYVKKSIVDGTFTYTDPLTEEQTTLPCLNPTTGGSYIYIFTQATDQNGTLNISYNNSLSGTLQELKTLSR